MYLLLAQTRTSNDHVAKSEHPVAAPSFTVVVTPSEHRKCKSNLVGSVPMRFKSRKNTVLPMQYSINRKGLKIQFYDPHILTDRKRLFSVYFFSLFSFFKERSLSLSEQPQTHLICSYHVAKNVFHQGNCVRIKIKKCKFNANWGGLKTFFKITQYADVVDIKFSVQTVLANIINTRSTGRTEYFVRRKSQTNSF